MIISLTPSVNRYLIVVVGFVCPSDPRGYVVQGLLPLGRVSHGKVGEGPGQPAAICCKHLDKERS